MFECSSLHDEPAGILAADWTKALRIPVLLFVWGEYCLGKYSLALWLLGPPQIRKMNRIIPRFSSQHAHFLAVASCNCAPKTFRQWRQRLLGLARATGLAECKSSPKSVCQPCCDTSHEGHENIALSVSVDIDATLKERQMKTEWVAVLQSCLGGGFTCRAQTSHLHGWLLEREWDCVHTQGVVDFLCIKVAFKANGKTHIDRSLHQLASLQFNQTVLSLAWLNHHHELWLHPAQSHGNRPVTITLFTGR